jgi:hypothetical protein
VLSLDLQRRRRKTFWEDTIDVRSPSDFVSPLGRSAVRHGLRVLYLREEGAAVTFKIEGLPDQIADFKRSVDIAVRVVNF